ncbi:altronate hydrolase [Campylobacter sp. P255]|uniref:UxaA family hydrolase n=1 Tax=Campylobacter sp. P255 TaxID=1979368 RepID=UPI000EA957BF|nr:UxaA family hydrolase [Campylobacter sp. P255]RKO64122.1 altronate hydrolase [Campylobacter sp. P255]
MSNFIIVHEKDNVATALKDLQKGEELAGVILREDIKNGHKFAIKTIDKNQLIIKYSEAIAMANKTIYAGEWVHTHNIDGIRARGDKEE